MDHLSNEQSPTRPPTAEEEAAAQWAAAKTRVERVRQDNDRLIAAAYKVTDSAACAAIADERAAWRRLEYLAGRAAPQAPSQCMSTSPSRA